MDVARPRVLIGFKDRSLAATTDERLDREVATRVLLDRLFGPASEIREGLHQRGLVDDTLSWSFLSERTFGVTVLGCETERPEAVAEVLRDTATGAFEIDDTHLERVRRKHLGQFVRGFDSVQSMAFAHAEEALEGMEPFTATARLAALTPELVKERQRAHLDPVSSAVVVVSPG
jgi:predicted Zn-dependent peptidase